jgi:DNA primase
LKALGVLNEKGNERFYGRVVVPIFDNAGEVCGLYGRRLDDEQPRHLYLPGAHRGVWNGAAFKVHQSVLLTESIFDAMSLWQAGFKNAVALYGKEGWTPDHEKLLQESGVREITLCLDNDEAGHKATAQLKKEVLPALMPSLAIHTLTWPDGVKDANNFFLSRHAVDFEMLLRAANPQTEQVSEQSAKLGVERIEMMPDGFVASYGANGGNLNGSRRYELRAIERPSAARLKATVKALGSEAGRFHIDTVDFYLSAHAALL